MHRVLTPPVHSPRPRRLCTPLGMHLRHRGAPRELLFTSERHQSCADARRGIYFDYFANKACRGFCARRRGHEDPLDTRRSPGDARPSVLMTRS